MVTNTNVVLFQENEALLEQNLRLEQELKEARLDLRIEKREVEKKASLLTFIREREAKNKERIGELEAKMADLETSLETLKYVTTFSVFCAEYLSGIDLHRMLRCVI
jgi:predicted nuclease with TOPRIM domain